MNKSRRTVDLICVIAGVAWAAAILTFLAGVAIAALTSSHALGAGITIGSVFLLCIAGLTSIHAMLQRHLTAVANAFELGREVGRAEDAVPLQRVR